MEEEIIKNANEIIYNAECWIDDEECTDAELEWGKFEKNAVQGLLDLYNKEKEKSKKCEYYEEIADELYKANQAHQKINGELRIKIKELENADLTVVYLDGVYDGEKKWKDKIKEKIEEVKNSKENYTFSQVTSEDIRRTIITNLQELLGE